MVSINGIAYQLPCCQKNIFTTTQSPTETQVLKHKIDHTWNTFCFALKAQIHPPAQKHIQTQIDQTDKIEATETKPVFCSTLRRSFASSMAAIKAVCKNLYTDRKTTTFNPSYLTLHKWCYALFGARDNC